MLLNIVELVNLNTNIKLEGKFGTTYEYAPFVYGYNNSNQLPYQLVIDNSNSNLQSIEFDPRIIRTKNALKYMDFIRQGSTNNATIQLGVKWDNGIKVVNGSSSNYYSNLNISDIDSVASGVHNTHSYLRLDKFIAHGNTYANADENIRENQVITYDGTTINVSMYVSAKTLIYEVYNEPSFTPSVSLQGNL